MISNLTLVFRSTSVVPNLNNALPLLERELLNSTLGYINGSLVLGKLQEMQTLKYNKELTLKLQSVMLNKNISNKKVKHNFTHMHSFKSYVEFVIQF